MTPVWTVLRVNPYRARATVDGVAVEVWKQDAVRDLPAGYLPGIALTPGTRSWPNGVRRLLRGRLLSPELVAALAALGDRHATAADAKRAIEALARAWAAFAPEEARGTLAPDSKTPSQKDEIR